MAKLGSDRPPDLVVVGETTPTNQVHVDELLRLAVHKGASDLHLKADRPPVLRIYGALIPQDEYAPLRKEDVERLYGQLANVEQRAAFERDLELDLIYKLEGIARFRVNIGKQRGTIVVTARCLSLTIPSLDSLGLPHVCKELAMKARGLVLVTGPTGSGKSTTLAAMLEYLNENRDCRIITCENLIEYVLQDQRGIVTQRELGEDTTSLASALHQALRQDADVIMVSEMCDPQTMRAAISAAETGHLVLSAMHTPGAVRTVERIVEVFPPAEQPQVRTQIADVLEGVLSQTLLTRMDGRGRVAAVEVLVASPAVRNLIREGKSNRLSGLMETSPRLAMKTLDQALTELLQRGLVSEREVLAKAANPEHMRSLLQPREPLAFSPPSLPKEETPPTPQAGPPMP